MTARITLRPVTENDLPVLYRQQLDPDAVRMAAFPSRDRPAFDAHWRKILADPMCVARAIVENGEVAGNVGVWGPPGERLVGYWIGREYWGRGIATAALALLLAELAERPIYAHVAKANVGSIRVLEKCGFKVVGEARPTDAPGGEAVAEWIMKVEARPSSC